MHRLLMGVATNCMFAPHAFIRKVEGWAPRTREELEPDAFLQDRRSAGHARVRCMRA